MASSSAPGDLGDSHTRRRDACPSAHASFEAADGALLRVRVPGGTIGSCGLRAISAAAALSDNGIIELTNRANIQLRGFTTSAAARALAVLVDADLVHPDGGADARRNVIGSPLAGIDTDELVDVRPTVAAVADVLTGWTGALSPKFGVIVDGGGPSHLRGRRHDVVLGAVIVDGRVVFEVGFGEALPVGHPVDPCTRVLVVEVGDAARLVAVALGLGMGLGHRIGDRPADVVMRLGRDAALTALSVAAGGRIVDSSRLERPALPSSAPIGVGNGWVGGAPVLGRMDASALMALADVADRFGRGEVRITTRRSVVVPVRSDADVHALRLGLETIGMYTDVLAPAASVIACAGSTGCTSGEADTQADALALIARLPWGSSAAATPVHVSGCPKRCASRSTAMLTLVAAAGRYDVFDAAGPIAADLEPADAFSIALTRASRSKI